MKQRLGYGGGHLSSGRENCLSSRALACKIGGLGEMTFGSGSCSIPACLTQHSDGASSLSLLIASGWA